MDGAENKKKQYKGNDAYLDLIVHKRNYYAEVGFPNLIVAEMKMPKRNFEEDKKRLRDLTDKSKPIEERFGYELGAALRVDWEKELLVIDEIFYDGQSEIEDLTLRFRAAIEKVITELEIPLSHFPRGCCGEASILLSEWLKEHGINSSYVCGKRGEASHAWLELEDKRIIDITGDQFDDYDVPVYVGKRDVFHKGFRTIQKHTLNGYHNYDTWPQTRFKREYEIIKKSLI